MPRLYLKHIMRGGDVSPTQQPKSPKQEVAIITDCKDLPSENEINMNKPKYEVLADKFSKLKLRKKKKLKFEI